jgi:tryptophan synthase alpha chain
VSRKAGRLHDRFDLLKAEGRAGLITFVTAGDPNRDISAQILGGLPAAGADIIELGIPFSDPMADGPAIQAASLRALKAGQTLAVTLEMVKNFRRDSDDTTPVALMGYYNPINIYGVDRFVDDAANAGIDGLIVVDLPPEEDAELRVPAAAAGIDLVKLTTPTSDEARLPKLVETASGFIYHVSITGITGTRSAANDHIATDIARIRSFTTLPLAVGFGIRTPSQAAAIARIADAAVVGSAIVEIIADKTLESSPESVASPDLVESVLKFVSALADGVRNARS